MSVVVRNSLFGVDIRFLETLVAVFECGSVAEAGRRLNMTAAGVAQRIHALEADIGTRLVFRSGRNIRPTPTGIAILDRSRRLLRDVRDIKSIATSGMLTGELRLGVIPTTLSGLLPDILIPFTKAHTKIGIQIVRDHSVALYRRVIDGEIDAAITSHPPFVIPKTCGWSLIREEPLVLMTSQSMRMRDPHEILTTQPFIRLTRNVYAGQLIDNYLHKVGIRPKEIFEIDGFELIAMLVDRGLGVTILPDWPQPWPEGLSLRKIPLPDCPFQRRIGILWNRSSLRLKMIEALVENAHLTIKQKRASAALRTRRGR